MNRHKQPDPELEDFSLDLEDLDISPDVIGYDRERRKAAKRKRIREKPEQTPDGEQ